MLVSLLPVPFAEAARQRQFAALEAALRAEDGAPATVLLGNLAAWTELAADALLLRPAGLVLLVLTPGAGHLTIPALAYGNWQLAGHPLPGRDGADNPFVQYQQQAPAAQAWLATQLGLPAAAQLPCAGIALFEAPLTFGPEVEAQLHRHAADDFQLVGEAAQLPARLRPLLAAHPPALTEDELLDWGHYLAHEPYVTHAGKPEDFTSLLAHKLRQLWRWLGAEDIPADPPYGGAPLPDPAERDQQEQARLQQLRQELQAELRQHRQEAAAREAARTQELTQLRQQLAQASPSAAARQAEQQVALEAAVRTARAELAAQNHELEARIQHLGQLMQQLQASALAPAATGAGRPLAQVAAGRRAPGGPARVTRAPAKAAGPLLRWSSYRPLRQAERWGVLGLALALLGGGAWGVVHLASPTTAKLTRQATLHRARAASLPNEEASRPSPVIIYDTLASDRDLPPAATNATLAAEPSAPEATPVAASSANSLPVDSTALLAKPAPLAASDTAAPAASPTP